MSPTRYLAWHLGWLPECCCPTLDNRYSPEISSVILFVTIIS